MLIRHGTMTNQGKRHAWYAFDESGLIMCRPHKKKGKAKPFADGYLDEILLDLIL